MKDDLNTFAQHGVGLVFYCELHKDHHNRVRLPMIAMAPGWKLYHAEVSKVWPL